MSDEVPDVSEWPESFCVEMIYFFIEECNSGDVIEFEAEDGRLVATIKDVSYDGIEITDQDYNSGKLVVECKVMEVTGVDGNLELLDDQKVVFEQHGKLGYMTVPDGQTSNNKGDRTVFEPFVTWVRPTLRLATKDESTGDPEHGDGEEVNLKELQSVSMAN